VKFARVLALCAMLVLLTVVLSGCVPGDGANTDTRPAGFFWGVWHGWIAPFSLIYSLFNPDIGLYEVHNSGFWYNLGFYMAIVSGFGGLTLSRKRRRQRDRSDD
jgi:hypothetical protein